MMRYKAQGTEVLDIITGERAGFLSVDSVNSAAHKLNYEEVEREYPCWEFPRYVVEGKTVIDLAWDRVAKFSDVSSAASSAYYLNNGESRTGDFFWDRRSKVAEEAPRYVVDSTEPDCYKVRDSTSGRYAPFSTAGGARRTAAKLNKGGDDTYYTWIGDATHEELSRKDEPEPELEDWEIELLASCGTVEIPERRFTAEVYTDGVDGRTYGIVRDSGNDTFAPMDSPFDAAVWAQRLNANTRESRKLAWLGGEPSYYFE